MMSGGRMNPAASDDFPFAAMQPPPYVGFDHAGGGGQRHQGAMMYDNFDYAATFGQFQDAPNHQMLALPPSGDGAGGLVPMAPPPMPGMQLQMPPMPHGMHGHGDVYPAMGMVKREGGAGDAGRIGLNLGRRTYFSPGDMMAVDRILMRSRLGGVFGLGFGRAHHQAPRCQVEDCKVDLSGAKHYHRRHKVCEYHAKAALVAAAGKQQRFCQQCSRFHVLTEFDEAKRSCRRRLAEHNRRRRKPAAGTTATSSKDSAPPSKKPNAGAISGSYTADNNTLSTTKSTISSNTSAISFLQQGQARAVAATRPTTLTLGSSPERDDRQQQLHNHQEQQHFITSLLHNNINNSNILSCSSVSSSTMPSAATANGEVSNQNNDNANNNMHMFEVDFM
ncbi:hypothetical protein CFC21_105214 [Triticum aestivum]|uniref:SBP-type domain-containing protein n=3 Tax=Triticum TaxID=4564 RepID=A0A9R1AAT3_TRITD|nr:squamosa promoter-binding-like protein 10 [Triticum dicoccoides]XP_044433588.1 squamosa promoter-binding-like protein 10 [Triticum aestivum]KAF7104308.1 hypothetical protein CFC21_105214 [Triticum aestivum]VAI92736.1 unnamed protein product [Triticum turgidum subsp. durum]